MARPAVHPTTERLYRHLGSGLTAPDEAAGWHLLTFLEAIGRQLGAVDDVIRDTDAGPGWSQIMDVDTVPLRYLPWLGQLIGAQVDPAASEVTQRASVKSSQGFSRGTRAALIAAVQLELTGNKTVYVQERDTSPYHFAIQTIVAETPSTARVTLAIDRQKPAGLQYTYTTVTSRPIDTLVGTIDEQPGSIDSLT